MASSLRSVNSSPRLLGSETPRIFTKPLRKLTPHTSRGFEVIQFAEDVLEIELFPWQKWLLIHALELTPDNLFRFRTIVLLVARQNGKSTLMVVLTLWRLYIDGALLVLGTAQNLDIAEEVWQSAVDIAEEIPELAAEIAEGGIVKTNGKKAFKLVSGSRYKVQAASRRGGRGLTADLVLLDELREHQTWDAYGAITKTTRTRPLAQIWAASNAGDLTSVVLGHLRRLAHLALGDPDGINGDDVRLDELESLEDEDSIGIFEWSAEPGVDVHDRDGWAQANPSMGHVMSMERSIAADARTDPEAVFRTEVLCQWVDSMQEGAFPPGVWESNVVSEDIKIAGQPFVSVEYRTGLHQSFAICAAGRAADGTELIELVHYESGMDERWAIDHITDTALSVLKDRGLFEIVIDKFGDNGHLIQRFADADIVVRLLDTTDMRNGAVGMTDALINGRLKHHSAEPLNVAVLGAGKRKSGEQFLWSQSKSTTDIAPLRAATAAWWAMTGEPADYDMLNSFY